MSSLESIILPLKFDLLCNLIQSCLVVNNLRNFVSSIKKELQNVAGKDLKLDSNEPISQKHEYLSNSRVTLVETVAHSLCCLQKIILVGALLATLCTTENATHIE